MKNFFTRNALRYFVGGLILVVIAITILLNLYTKSQQKPD